MLQSLHLANLQLAQFAILPFVACASLCGTYLYRGIAGRHDIVAKINSRSLHSRLVPRGGGIAFAVVFAVSVIVVWGFGGLPTWLMLCFGVGGGAAALIGFVDDVRDIRAMWNSAQIGNFLGIKNSEIGSGSRINHLAFIGEATLESNVTIGADVITCNHNGVGVSRTEIKAGAYVGSGCKLVAPLSIGENATIGAGSTIAQDVPAGKLTVARSRQLTVEHWARPDKKSADK